MTKRSSIHIYIIISCLILVIGAAIGTVCHFVSNGFFNYGAENASGAEVTVNYSVVDYTQDGVEDICESAFSAQGLTNYSVATYEEEGYLVYSFSYGTDSSKLGSAVDSIKSQLETAAGENYNAAVTNASYSYYKAKVANSQAYIWASVAAAIAIAIEAAYIAVRYRIDMGAVSMLANIHSLLLLAAVMAITRIPFGTYFVAVSAICLLVSMISVLLFFAKVRSNFKEEEMSKLSPEERITGAAAATTKKTTWLCCAMLIVSAVYAIAALIATFSISAMAPALAAVCACVVCWYSSAVFTPAVYVRVRGNKAEKSAKAKKSKKEN